jgi:transposase
MEALRQLECRRQGRQAEPSAGSVDSQSSKTAPQATEVGFDGGKQVKGRKRQLLVDTLGLRIAVVVTAANTDDRVGLRLLVTHYFLGGVRRLRKLWVDSGYQAEWLVQWVSELKQTYKIDLEVTGNKGKGFHVIPWRWAVERTFAWLLNDRRHSRDYERLTTTSEAMIQLSMIRLLLNRLA